MLVVLTVFGSVGNAAIGRKRKQGEKRENEAAKGKPDGAPLFRQPEDIAVLWIERGREASAGKRTRF